MTRFILYPLQRITPDSPYWDVDTDREPVDLRDEDGESPVSLAAARYVWIRRENVGGADSKAAWSPNPKNTHYVCGIPPYAVAWDESANRYAVRIEQREENND